MSQLLKILGKWLIALSERRSQRDNGNEPVVRSLTGVRAQDLNALAEDIALELAIHLKRLSDDPVTPGQACTPPHEPAHFMVALETDTHSYGLMAVLAAACQIDNKFSTSDLYHQVVSNYLKEHGKSLSWMERCKDTSQLFMDEHMLSDAHTQASLTRLTDSVSQFVAQSRLGTPFCAADLFEGTFVLGQLCKQQPWRSHLAHIAHTHVEKCRDEILVLRPASP